MLLIDENAAPRLIAALTTYRAAYEDARYIFFSLPDSMNAGQFHQAISDASKRFANSENTQLYFLKNGDVCLLSTSLHSSVANPLIDMVCSTLRKPADTEWIAYQKLGTDHLGLADMIRCRIAAERSEMLNEAARKEQMKQELRRKVILGGGSKSQVAEINSRRKGRDRNKIMIIEDDAFTLQLVNNVLKKHFDTVALASAENALDMYSSLAPDMLLLDINLPDVTGHELLERIMQLDPNAYVVMLSGSTDTTNIRQAIVIPIYN